MSEPRDAIAFDALDDVRVDCMAYCYGGSIDKREAADAVLAMPEMQAVRSALREASERQGCLTLQEALADMGLPPSVIAWVLEGEQ